MEFPTNKEQWLQGFDIVHKNTAIEHLGIELIDIDDQHIELSMPVSDKARQPYGLLHGGISMALAETAASVHATWGRDLTQVQPVGIEINGSHVRSASDGVVHAVANVVRRSNWLIVHEVEIIHEDTGKLLTTARVTNFYKPLKGGS